MAEIRKTSEKKVKQGLIDKVISGEITIEQARLRYKEMKTRSDGLKEMLKAEKRFEKAMKGKEAALKAAKKNPTEKNMQKAAMPLGAFAPKVKTSSKAAPTVNKSFNDKISAVLSDENMARFHADPVMREAAQARLSASSGLYVEKSHKDITPRVEDMMVGELQRTASLSDNPHERETAVNVLNNYYPL